MVPNDCDTHTTESVQGTFCYTDDGEMKVTFSFWVQKEEDPNPKEYGLATFSSWFGTRDLLLFSKHFDI